MSKLFRTFRSYSDGFLPEKGALTDHPNNLVICLDEISLAKGVLDKEDQDKANSKSSSTNDGGWKPLK